RSAPFLSTDWLCPVPSPAAYPGRLTRLRRAERPTMPQEGWRRSTLPSGLLVLRALPHAGPGVAGDDLPDDLLHEAGYLCIGGGSRASVDPSQLVRKAGRIAMVEHRVMRERHQICADIVDVDHVALA